MSEVLVVVGWGEGGAPFAVVRDGVAALERGGPPFASVHQVPESHAARLEAAWAEYVAALAAVETAPRVERTVVHEYRAGLRVVGRVERGPFG